MTTGSVPLLESEAEYAKAAKGQRDSLEVIARKLEAGEALNDLETAFAAAALRHVAELIPASKPKQRGHQPEFCHGSEALLYVTRRAQGVTRVDALAEAADRLGKSEVAVEKAIKKHLPDAVRALRAMGAHVPANLFGD